MQGLGFGVYGRRFQGFSGSGFGVRGLWSMVEGFRVLAVLGLC